MAYTETAEIESDFKDIAFTSTSNVKDTDVEQFIVEADALIDAHIGTRYSTPVTSGNGLSFLKLISRSLVAARIKAIMEVKQEKSKDADQNVRSLLLSPSQCFKMLESIRDGNLNLDGATALNSSSFSSGNVVNSVCPVIKKEWRQW